MKTETIGIRINEIEKETLKMMAEERDVPMSQLIREAIRKFIADNK